MPFNGGTKLKDGGVILNAYTSGQSSHDKEHNSANNIEYRVKKANGSIEYKRDIQGKDVDKK